MKFAKAIVASLILLSAASAFAQSRSYSEAHDKVEMCNHISLYGQVQYAAHKGTITPIVLNDATIKGQFYPIFVFANWYAKTGATSEANAKSKAFAVCLDNYEKAIIRFQDAGVQLPLSELIY